MSDVKAGLPPGRHRVLRIPGKGDKTTLVPLPPAVSRVVDTAIGERMAGPILLNRAV